MKLKDMAKQPNQPQGFALSDEEELDGDIAFGLLANLLYSDEGANIVQSSFQSENPVPTIAQFIAKNVEGVAKRLQGSEMNVSPNVWLAKGGAVERILEEVSEMSGGAMDDQMASAVLGEVVDTLKLAGQAEKRGRAQQRLGNPQMPMDRSQLMPPGGAPMPMPMQGQQGGV